MAGRAVKGGAHGRKDATMEFKRMMNDPALVRAAADMVAQQKQEFLPAEATGLQGLKKLDAIGEDLILQRIESGESEGEISRSLGIGYSSLARWIRLNPEREVAVRDSRRQSARAWYDRGLAALEASSTMFDLAKAREIANHCRKYAAVINPREFSERVSIEAEVTPSQSITEIDAKLQALLGASTAYLAAHRGEDEDTPLPQS